VDLSGKHQEISILNFHLIPIKSDSLPYYAFYHSGLKHYTELLTILFGVSPSSILISIDIFFVSQPIKKIPSCDFPAIHIERKKIEFYLFLRPLEKVDNRF